jgi:hypothetical protein
MQVTMTPKLIRISRKISILSVTLDYVTLDYVTLDYVTLDYVTLDYVTLDGDQNPSPQFSAKIYGQTLPLTNLSATVCFPCP